MQRHRSRPPKLAAMSERLTKHQVAHVAKLARLDVTEDELALYTEQLAAVLDHAAAATSIDTSGVEPTAHPHPLVNVLRDDNPRPGIDRDEVLACAPVAEDGRFHVPRILGEEG